MYQRYATETQICLLNARVVPSNLDRHHSAPRFQWGPSVSSNSTMRECQILAMTWYPRAELRPCPAALGPPDLAATPCGACGPPLPFARAGSPWVQHSACAGRATGTCVSRQIRSRSISPCTIPPRRHGLGRAIGTHPKANTSMPAVDLAFQVGGMLDHSLDPQLGGAVEVLAPVELRQRR